MYICLKCTQFLKINAGNPLSVRNEEASRRARIQRELASRADQRVLRWFRHVERMDEYRIARKERKKRKERKNINSN